MDQLGEMKASAWMLRRLGRPTPTRRIAAGRSGGVAALAGAARSKAASVSVFMRRSQSDL
jgi:hypothetical protein